MRVTVIPIVISALGTNPETLKERLEKLKIKGKKWDHPTYRIIKIG